MKITHLTTVHPPDDNRIFKICKSIARTGRVVSFVVPTDEDRVVEGVAIKAVPKPSSRWRRMLRTTWHVYRRALRERADIYQFHDPELIPVGLALRVFTKSAVIYDIHENVPEQMLSKSYLPGLLRKAIVTAFDWFERCSARGLSALVTANVDINERFSSVSDRIVVIHNYADRDEFCNVPETDNSRYKSGLVFHSAASDRTSFPAVMRAVELIPKGVNFKLMVTGCSADEAEEAEQLMQQFPTQRSESLGLLTREEFAQTLLRSAVSLVLYDQPRNHSSIRSNRFYESLAAAAPVIVPDFPEWHATVASIGCGLSVDPADPEAIAGAVSYLLTHPEESAAMGKRGRLAFLQMFSWEHETERLLELYGTLLGEDPRDPANTVTNLAA
jgi:glycosyltransferase involved in cell wall biosynthesis